MGWSKKRNQTVALIGSSLSKGIFYLHGSGALVGVGPESASQVNTSVRVASREVSSVRPLPSAGPSFVGDWVELSGVSSPLQ